MAVVTSGQMTDANPYSTPSSFETAPVVGETPSTRRLWIAYGIAPLVAPLVAAIAVFVTGLVYQTTHPEDVEVNPMSMVFAPVLLLIVGVPASYGVAGLIGMPIAFWLRKRGRLNGYTVHGAALLWAVVLGSGLVIAALLMKWHQTRDRPDFIEFLGGAFVIFLASAPFILLSATTFWLIGVRQWKRSSP